MMENDGHGDFVFMKSIKKRILMGTSNPSKLPYLCSWFDGIDIECVSPASVGLSGFDASENGRTAEENAIEKARSWYDAAKMPVFALDAGLVFLDLPEDAPIQPGVHVRRAAGHVMDDREMLEWFIDVAHKNGGHLRAAWQDSYCIMKDPEHYDTYTFSHAELEANAFLLVDRPCGIDMPGWPLNGLMVDINTGKYLFEITEEETRENNAAYKAKEENNKKLGTWIAETAERIL